MESLFGAVEQFTEGLMSPGFDRQRKVIEKIVWNVLKSENFKNELSNYIRLENEAYRTNSSQTTLSYSMLTRGNVNMQSKMAASGYEVYGRTVLKSNKDDYDNKSIYKRMRSRINYGKNTAVHDYGNKGQRSVI